MGLHFTVESFKLQQKNASSDAALLKNVSQEQHSPSTDTEMQFPSRDKFYNKLSDCECNIKEYLDAKLLLQTFNCKPFKNYHDLYLKSDVLLQENYGIDPAHFYSVPGMAWDSVLKMTKMNLELCTDEEMYIFVERSIRGGISRISKRYDKANKM